MLFDDHLFSNLDDFETSSHMDEIELQSANRSSNDAFNDTLDDSTSSKDEDTTMSKQFSLSGALGFDRADGGGNNGQSSQSNGPSIISRILGDDTGGDDHESNPEFHDSMDDISQDYFAALTENQLDAPEGDEGDGGDNDFRGEGGDDDNDMFFDASMTSEFMATADYSVNLDDSVLSPRKEPKKTIRFAADVVFKEDGDSEMMVSTSYLFGDVSDDSGISEASLDLFGTHSKDTLNTSSSSMTSTDSGSIISDEDDTVDEVKEEERRLLRGMLFAGFGAGLVGFVGWSFGKIMNRVRSSNDADIGADALQTGAETAANQASEVAIHAASEAAMQGTESAAFNASMTSSNMSSTFVGAPLPNGGMTGPQYVLKLVIRQTMRSVDSVGV